MVFIRVSSDNQNRPKFATVKRCKVWSPFLQLFRIDTVGLEKTLAYRKYLESNAQSIQIKKISNIMVQKNEFVADSTF